MTKFKELDTVCLSHNIQEKNLKKGDIGAIVAVYENGSSFEVEFLETDGRTKALLTLSSNEILPYVQIATNRNPIPISLVTVGTPVFFDTANIVEFEKNSNVNFDTDSGKEESTYRMSEYKFNPLWA